MREFRHRSGMVEFLPDRGEEEAKILAEHGVSAIAELLRRIRRVEVAIGLPSEDESGSVGFEHPIEEAARRLEASLSAIAQRARGIDP